MESQSEAKAAFIVNDDQDIVRPLAFRLEVEGFQVILEPDGQIGYDRAVAEHPDLILLDVMMPGLDGGTVCNILKQRVKTRGIPIIMVTAKTKMGDVERAFAAHADDYIATPFEWSELLAKVRRLID